MSLQLQSYPFQSHFLNLKDKLKLHFIQEGQGEKTVLVHGNPTWSFLFRHLVKDLTKNGFEAIAPDHIGCGLSDKPQDYSYTLKQHIENFSSFMKQFKEEKVNLVVHDWGGAIAFGWAVQNPERINKIVISNTAAFLSKNIPKRIALCKNPLFNSFIIRRCNGFARPALYMATAKGLSKEAKKGFIHPYNNYKNRIAVAKFVEDIPLTKDHPSYQTLLDIEKKLPLLDRVPKLILWGMKDFCFDQTFLKQWESFYPDAEIKKFEEAGHYLFEDEKKRANQSILNFLKK